jgi:hypothetical protein
MVADILSFGCKQPVDDIYLNELPHLVLYCGPSFHIEQKIKAHHVAERK